MNTDWAGLGSTAPNIATASLGGPITGNASFFLRANGPTFFDKGGSDNISQDGTIVMVPSAANQTFQVTFANAAPGGIDSAVNGAGWSYVNGSSRTDNKQSGPWSGSSVGPTTSSCTAQRWAS